MKSGVWRGCAGIMTLVLLLLNGCGSAGGADQGGASSAAAGTTAVSAGEDSAGTATEAAGESPAGTSEDSTDKTPAGTTEPAAGTAASAAGQASSDEQASSEAAGAVSLEDVYARIEQEVSLNSPMTVPEEYIANYFGIDVSAAEEYLFVMSEAAISAETIIIVKTDSENQQAVADSLQQVIDQKAAEMENYLPDQYDIVNKSSVRQAGDYVWLVISENAEAIQAIIEDELQ